MSTSMIVLASEQIWPNLLGFLHWHQKLGGISHLFVYATNNEQKSLGPARRFKELIARAYPEVVTLPEHDEPHEMTPQAVRMNIDEWMYSFPADKWVINLTGGTKMMTAGLLDYAGRADVELIYRELERAWFSLGKDPETGQIYSRSLQDIDEGIADSVPIDKLIMTQFDVAEGDHWELEPARQLPIPSIIRAAIDVEWDWRKAFNAAGIPFEASKSGGNLFEELVAACVIELGVTNVMINARHLSSNKTQRQEIDVLASHDGALYMIDCKLAFPEDPAVPAPVAQIKEASETRRTLGGLSAKALMIRPSWEEDEERIDFAKALHVEIIQRGSTETLIQQLGDWMGRPLSPSLIETQAIFEEIAKTNKYPLSSTKAKMLRQREAPVVSLEQNLITAMDEDCQDWSCISWRGSYHFLFRPKTPDTALKNALVRILSSYGQIVYAEFSESKKTLRIELKPETESKKPLRTMLETKRHSNWLDSLVIEECDKLEKPIPAPYYGPNPGSSAQKNSRPSNSPDNRKRSKGKR